MPHRSAPIHWLHLIALCLSTIAIANTCIAQDTALNFNDHIKPIFRDHCAGCHNTQKKRGGLALDNYAAAMDGGSSGAVIEAGDLENSRLWNLVNHDDEPAMPPDQDPIPQEKRDLIRQWIATGAIEKSGDKAKAPKKSAFTFEAPELKPGEAIMPEGICQQPIETPARPAAIPSVACSPVAPLLAIAAPQQIVLYQIESGELLGILPFLDGIPEVVKFSADGSLLIASGGQNSRRGWAIVYDVRTGMQLSEVGDELDTALAADVNRSLNRVAMGGPQRLVRVYSLSSMELIKEVNKHNDWVQSIAYSPDEQVLATADRSGAIWLWEADTGRELKPLTGHTDAIHELAWRSDSKVLASASQDGTVRVWDVAGGKQIRSLKADAKGAIAVAFAVNGNLLTTGRSRDAKVWDSNGKLLATLGPLTDTGLCATFDPLAKFALVGDWQGNVQAWSVDSKKLLRSYAANPAPLELRHTQLALAASDASKNAAQIEQKLDQLRKQLREAVSAHELVLSQAKAASDELGKLSEDAEAADDASAPDLTEVADPVTTADPGNTGESANASTGATNDGESLQAAVDQIKARAEHSAEAIQQFTHLRAELTQQIDELARENKRAGHEAQRLTETASQVESALRHFKNRELELRKNIQSADYEVQKYSNQITIARRASEKLKSALSSVQAALSDLEATEGNLDDLDGLRNKLESEIEAQGLRIRNQQAALARLARDAANRRMALETYQKAYSK